MGLAYYKCKIDMMPLISIDVNDLSGRYYTLCTNKYGIGYDVMHNKRVVSKIKITNGTRNSIIISFDGINAHEALTPLDSVTIDLKNPSDKFVRYIAENTCIYLKFDHQFGEDQEGIGAVYISAYCKVMNTGDAWVRGVNSKSNKNKV